MKIYIAADHAGFKLKGKLKTYLERKGFAVEDLGPFKYNKNDDYPDFISQLAKKLSKSKKAKGIVLGASGQGEAIVSNKTKGIRAGVYYGGNLKIVKLMRQHNDANVLSMGARFILPIKAKKAVNLFLKTPFEGGRHLRRIKKIERLK